MITKWRLQRKLKGWTYRINNRGEWWFFWAQNVKNPSYRVNVSGAKSKAEVMRIAILKLGEVKTEMKRAEMMKV